MNKYIRRSLTLLLVLALLLVSFSTNVFAAPQVINQTVEKQTVTSGVVLEKYNRFTTSGWIKIDVLKIDLLNEYVKVDSIVNKTSSSKLTSVSNLAKTSGAIAAVNGSYFDMGSGYAYGPIMSSGVFDLAATRNNTDLATFSLDEMNNALYAYWNTKVELITSMGERKPVAAYNRYNGTFNGMQIVDSKWGSKTPGATAGYPDWLEMVVEDGLVKEFRPNLPGVEIPKNGFVVLASSSHSKVLLDSFKIGDLVGYDISMNVDSSNMKMALTGGSLLVQDGKVISNFTKYPAAANTRQPSTALGTTADGKTLIVVAVDGRSGTSIGMTQAELADYMKELGCANAINFDGGGSTTMVARESGTTGLSTVNTPSDGSARPVSNALGIFSTAPKGIVNTLLVTAYEPNVFVNTSRAFNARGLDQYMNPANINTKDIIWSVTGVNGTFIDNTFYPTSVGEAVVTAKLGDTVVGTCPISVLSAPVKLDLNYDLLNTDAGKSTTFALTGLNKNGYSASIVPSHVKWSVSGNVGTVASNIFTAGKTGTGYVRATFAGASVYCPVSLKQTGLTKVIENFSSNALKLVVSSKAVTAKYAPATNVYKSAPYSGKLTYNFSKELKTNRAAYVNLPNGGYILDTNTTKLGMWAYSSAKKPVWIGATVYDTKGNYKSEYFAKGITWTGWKYLEVSLDDINNPKKVTNVFAVEATKHTASGTLYFDNLTMVYTGYPEVVATKTASSTVPKDESNVERYVSGADSLSFSVFGQASAYTVAKNKTQTTMLSTLSNRINKYLQASVVVGSVDNLSPSVKTPLLSTAVGYKALDMNGNRLIQLNTTKGGLRLTSSYQWSWLKDQLSSFTGKNLFVFLAKDPASFNDAQEGALLKETLTNYKKQNVDKNVWVFYNGSSNSSYTERGIKYISTTGFDNVGFTDKNKSAAKFVTVKAKGDTVTYQFKSFN
ncbi:MAG TPA: phosphodiester glycosidase family protein [Ruminiclostridium sp.]